MAASSKTGSYPLRALMAAAVTAIALAMAVPAGVANGQDQGIDRGIIPMAPDAPSRYVVVPGDTLWDISQIPTIPYCQSHQPTVIPMAPEPPAVTSSCLATRSGTSRRNS